VVFVVGYVLKTQFFDESASPQQPVPVLPPSSTPATTPGPTTPAKPPPTPKKEHSAGTTSTTPGEATPGPALDVQVGRHSNGPWLLPGPLSALPAPPKTKVGRCPTGAWVRGLGGANAGEMRFVVYVTGIAPRPVILDGAKVIAASAAPPLHGHTVSCGEGEGGPLQLRRLEAIVGPNDSTPRYVPGPDPRNPRASSTKPLDFRFALPRNHVEAFDVHAVTRGCNCRWKLRLSYLADGRRRSYDVTDGGQPFALSSDEASSDALFESGRWRKP
jgi:hypothetical protein